MAITFIGEAHGTCNYTTSITVSVPASTANNDVMIAVVGGTRASAPSGWTLIGSAASGTSSLGTCYAYYRVASSEPGSYTFTSSSAALACAGIATYRGVNTSTPVDAGSTVNAVGATTNFNTNTVTASSNQWLFSFAIGYEFGSSSVRTYSEGSGTERADFSVTNSGSPDNTVLAYTDSNGTVSAGSISRTQTRSAAASGGVNGAILLNAANTSGSVTPSTVAVTATAFDIPAQGIGVLPNKGAATVAAFNPTVFAGHFAFAGLAGVSVAVLKPEETGRAAVAATAFAPAQVFFGTPSWRKFIVDKETRTIVPTDTRTAVIEAAT